MPQNIKDITLEDIARYFDTPNHQRRIHLPSHLNQRSQRDHQLDYLLHKRRNFETREVPNLIDLLQKQNLNPLDYIQQIHRNDLSPVRYIPSLDRYPEYDPFKVNVCFPNF